MVNRSDGARKSHRKLKNKVYSLFNLEWLCVFGAAKSVPAPLISAQSDHWSGCATSGDHKTGSVHRLPGPVSVAAFLEQLKALRFGEHLKFSSRTDRDRLIRMLSSRRPVSSLAGIPEFWRFSKLSEPVGSQEAQADW